MNRCSKQKNKNKNISNNVAVHVLLHQTFEFAIKYNGLEKTSRRFCSFNKNSIALKLSTVK